MSIVIKKGVKDPYIVYVQRALNEQVSSKLKPDGDFGPASEAALKTWQSRNGEEQSGVYEGNTAKRLDLFISNKYLTEKDFELAAQRLGVSVSQVKAVQLVESKGSGYLDDGRTIILFERHVFKQELDKILSANSDKMKSLAVKLGAQLNLNSVQSVLISKYPNIYNLYDSKNNGYMGKEAEYGRLQIARDLNDDAALRAASWGLFQVMGYHSTGVLKYSSASEMVANYSLSERNQLLSFCDFILADKRLLTAIRARDWPTFARWYNGPGFDKHVPPYDQRLRNAEAEVVAGVNKSKYVPVLA